MNHQQLPKRLSHTLAGLPLPFGIADPHGCGESVLEALQGIIELRCDRMAQRFGQGIVDGDGRAAESRAGRFAKELLNKTRMTLHALVELRARPELHLQTGSTCVAANSVSLTSRNARRKDEYDALRSLCKASYLVEVGPHG